MVWEARTSRTWEEPIPNAMAPKAPWVRGVGVAAADRHAGLGDTQLRAHHVGDPLLTGVGGEEADPVLLAVPLELDRHHLGDVLGEGPEEAGGGVHVIHDGEGPIGIQDRELPLPEHPEGLGRGDVC